MCGMGKTGVRNKSGLLNWESGPAGTGRSELFADSSPTDGAPTATSDELDFLNLGNTAGSSWLRSVGVPGGGAGEEPRLDLLLKA